MQKTSLFMVAAAMVAGSSLPAFAQGIDCTAAVDAIEYYCNHRDEFDKPAAATPAATPVVNEMAAPARPAHRATHTARHAMHPTKHHTSQASS